MSSSSSSSSSSVSCPLWSVSSSSVLCSTHPAVIKFLTDPTAVIAFPTETVYGLGGSALSSSAIERIYRAKGRPSDNPLIVHICDASQLHSQLGIPAPIGELEKKLIDKFWPGPLTILFPVGNPHASPLSPLVTAGLDTVAVRMPSHPVALQLLRETKLPLAAPSANRSGRPSPTRASHVMEDLAFSGIDGVIDGGDITSPSEANGGQAGIGIESTVVQCFNDPSADYSIAILRPGEVTLEMLESIAGKGRVKTPKSEIESAESEASASVSQGSSASSHPAADEDFIPIAPGMKYTHYAPRAPLTILRSNIKIDTPFLIQAVENAIANRSRQATSASASRPRIGILCFAEQYSALEAHFHTSSDSAIHLWSLGDSTNLAQLARQLYSSLRDCDSVEPSLDCIYAVDLSQCGTAVDLSAAIMNRLKKAAGNQILNKSN